LRPLDTIATLETCFSDVDPDIAWGPGFSGHVGRKIHPYALAGAPPRAPPWSPVLALCRRLRSTWLSAVEVIKLEKRFRRRRGRQRVSAAALAGVSFEIGRGECVAVLGQNGSGKSTLVRVLSTLLLPDAGHARVFGHDVVAESRAVRLLINRVSVEASFFKRMSAVENLSYAARFYGFGRGATRRRIPEILDRVGFPTARSTEPMEALSRGMQQKVALARALLTSPILLLLDEPTTGLDPRSKREVQTFIGEMRAEHDTTVLLCTHDLDEAEALADRIGILHKGRMLALDQGPELLALYGAATLEEAFFSATGAELIDEWEEEAS
jgi:ABC-2 type transport system ATP-binding protein